MHSYHLRAIKNYKDAFQLMRITKIERFNSRLYFYCVNHRINPLTIAVELSIIPPIITEGQSYTELPKKLWDRTKQIKGHKRAMLSKSRQSNTACTTQPGRQERSYSTRTESPHLPSWVYSKGKERMWSPAAPSFQR